MGENHDSCVKQAEPKGGSPPTHSVNVVNVKMDGFLGGSDWNFLQASYQELHLIYLSVSAQFLKNFKKPSILFYQNQNYTKWKDSLKIEICR